MIRQAMETAGLAVYAEIGLFLFCFAFSLILIRLFFFPKNRAIEMANIPFTEEETP